VQNRPPEVWVGIVAGHSLETLCTHNAMEI
jgi:hypothetical protein